MSQKESANCNPDCIIVPNSKCPQNCQLRRMSDFDKTQAADDPNSETTFAYQVTTDIAPLEITTKVIEINMDGTLDIGVSPRDCKNLKNWINSTSHIF